MLQLSERFKSTAFAFIKKVEGSQGDRTTHLLLCFHRIFDKMVNSSRLSYKEGPQEVGGLCPRQICGQTQRRGLQIAGARAKLEMVNNCIVSYKHREIFLRLKL